MGKPADFHTVHAKRVWRGLTEKEARKRLNEFGPNTLAVKSKVSAVQILLRQFSDFMVIILLASTAVSAFMGEMTEAFTIIAIVIINALLGFIQEYRTEKTLKALKKLAAPQAKVIREGRQMNIPAEGIVPGDIVVLETGDRVPADAMLLEAVNLQVDESILTGESIPVEKSAESGRKTADGPTAKNCVYMGTVIIGGKAISSVFATGMDTEMGKIADMIQSAEDDETPLQKKLDHMGKYIAACCLGICVMVSVAGILRGEELLTMLLAGISLAVAAVPEGLPAIVTVALALGVQRMLRRNALIRKLPAVETLGCASVICSDKTGTLTENRMTVKKIYAGDCMIEVKGVGYEPEGEFLLDGKRILATEINALRTALEIGGLCNNSTLERVSAVNTGIVGQAKSILFRGGTWQIHGDPTEGALLVVAAKAGLTYEKLNRAYTRIDEIPFDSERKCMSVVLRSVNGETYVMTKGAPDVIIGKCDRIYTSKGIEKLTPALWAKVTGINDKMTSEALRVLGVAYKRIAERPSAKTDIEKNLVFVGLIGMIDPPRQEAYEAVQKCKMAGIKPVMITGDHKNTAAAIARELKIYNGEERVVTGAELDKMSQKHLERIAAHVCVYARVSPKHKLQIVRTLKKLGHIVAMTGDGVNDAPAIKEADIGVAMGLSGTDVTREASSMVLLDDNFATIVAAVEEGRTIYGNIRKFIRYLLACNTGEVLTMFCAMVSGLPIPLLPIQILWVNLVTDGLPAMALALEPPEKDIMMQLPRGAKDNIFSGGLLKLIVLRGCVLCLCTLAVFVSILHFTMNTALARSGAFVTLVITQLTHVFECKSERKTLFEIPFLNNIYLVLAVFSSAIMILSAIYVPFLRQLFKTELLTLNEWMLICGFSALGPVVSTFVRKKKWR